MLTDEQLDAMQETGRPLQAPPPPRKHKIRPIALSEAWLKFTETCTIEQSIAEIVSHCEPHNLGVGTPDAAAAGVEQKRRS